jgi:hypothetical protein
MSPNGSPGGIGLEGLRVDLVGAPPEQERVDALHQGTEALADAVVPIGHRPAAVFEAAVAILVGRAGCLHHAVQRHEFRNSQFAHGVPSPQGNLRPLLYRGPQRLFLLAHLGRHRVAEVVGLEQRPDLELGATIERRALPISPSATRSRR